MADFLKRYQETEQDELDFCTDKTHFLDVGELKLKQQNAVSQSSGDMQKRDPFLDEDSDTEITNNTHSRVKSSNASLWSVDADEDWGDVEIPSNQTLTWIQKQHLDQEEDMEERGKNLDNHSSLELQDDTGSLNLDQDDEDGLDLGDCNVLELRLAPPCLSLAKSNASLDVLDGMRVVESDAFDIPSDCDNPLDQLDNDSLGDEKKTQKMNVEQNHIPQLETLEIDDISDFDKEDDDDEQDKKDNIKETAITATKTSGPKLITMEMMQEMINKPIDNRKSNQNMPISKPVTKPMTRSNSRLSQSSTMDQREKKTITPRSLSRQSSIDESHTPITKKKPWVSSVKPSTSKSNLSLSSSYETSLISRPSNYTSTTTPRMLALSRNASGSREDMKRPPSMMMSSQSDRTKPIFSTLSNSTKAMVKRIPPSPTALQSHLKAANAKSFNTSSLFNGSNAPPDRFSSGSSRDAKRPATHRVAFGRTLKDVPPQPQIKPKVRRQPMLIKNLGGSNTPKVIGSMVYDPIEKKWKGNESSLKVFDKISNKNIAATKPTLIPYTQQKIHEKVGEMVFDPIKCVWIGNEAEDYAHVFDEIDSFEAAESAQSGAKMGLVCDKALRDAFMRSETRHKLLIGSWYPRAIDSRFIRDTSKHHLWEIRNILAS